MPQDAHKKKQTRKEEEGGYQVRAWRGVGGGRGGGQPRTFCIDIIYNEGEKRRAKREVLLLLPFLMPLAVVIAQPRHLHACGGGGGSKTRKAIVSKSNYNTYEYGVTK